LFEGYSVTVDEVPRVDPMVTMDMRLGAVQADLAELCRKHAIQQFDLFGSILRDDFDSESDVDVLVTFKQGMTPSLFDRMKLERALSELFRRQVDLITMGAVTQSENALLRDEILSTRLTVYAE
jgi:predicted nucleotidyltransferase